MQNMLFSQTKNKFNQILTDRIELPNFQRIEVKNASVFLEDSTSFLKYPSLIIIKLLATIKYKILLLLLLLLEFVLIRGLCENVMKYSFLSFLIFCSSSKNKLTTIFTQDFVLKILFFRIRPSKASNHFCSELLRIFCVSCIKSIRTKKKIFRFFTFFDN